MYAGVDECTRMSDKDNRIKGTISERRTENEMKKFYLHLQVEVFFGLSCKNPPSYHSLLGREGSNEGGKHPVKDCELGEGPQTQRGQTYPFYFAENGDNKCNSFLSTSFIVHRM